MKLKQLFTILGVIGGLVIIGFILYALFPKATIVLSVAPEEFTLTINGDSRTAKTGDRVVVAPGDIEVTISRQGFDDFTQKLTLRNGDTTEILQALTANTDEARELLKTDKSQAIIQRVSGNAIQKKADELRKTYPILSVLPINDKFFSINPCQSERFPNDTSKIALCITLYDPEAKQAAYDEIARQGFKPGDYEIIVREYGHPADDHDHDEDEY